jgi:hypothetical protein
MRETIIELRAYLVSWLFVLLVLWIKELRRRW